MTTSPDQVATRQRRIIGVSLLVLAIGVALWIAFSIKHVVTTYNNGTLSLTVVPSDANILLDQGTTVTIKSTATSASLSLAPGSHVFTISRTGFTTKSVTITITARQSKSQTIVLGVANSAAAATYYQNNPDEATIADGVGQQEVEQNGQIISQNYPLINLLPYIGANYRIDFGVSVAHPNNLDAVAIYITADTTAGRTNALNWIRAQGYNPDAYEIIYQTSAQAAGQ